MYKADKWWASKRVYAGIAAVLALVASVFGVGISEAEITETLTAVGAAVAAVLAIWSKIRERKKADE